MKALYNNIEVIVLDDSKSRGWAFVEFPGGMQRNVRIKDLTLIEDEKVEFTLEEALALEIGEPDDYPELTKNLRTVGFSQYDPNKYVKSKSVSGNTTLHNGDATAVTLSDMPLGSIYSFVSVTIKVDVDELKSKYNHLNPGMQRMNLGNRLRAFYKKSQKS